MSCPACGHLNREAAKFCESCGARLTLRCPACATELRPGARFCDACGTPVAGAAGAGGRGPVASPGESAREPEPRPAVRVADVASRLAARLPGYTPRHLAEKILTSRSALEGERKQVTVLFADCAGFTTLARALDPEELHAVMDGCFEHLLAAVHRYEGTVNQFTGDGIMALFGAPIAHEDHAARAVAAALAIQARLRDYAEELRRRHGIEFAVRIGIHTGPVVVGKIGDDLRMDYTAQGETVNLAARLQQAAPPGGVLISEATHRLVSGYFITRDEEETALKGFDRPVRSFLVTGRQRRRARFDLAVERGLTPLVGRTRHLAFLAECWKEVQAGRGRIVSVVGDPGSGKSRLVYEFRRALTGAAVVEGRCLPEMASAPFHLVIELLQDDFAVRETADEGERRRRVERGVADVDPGLGWVVPYLKHLLALPAEELEHDGLEEAQRKRRMIEAVRAFVLRAAQARPLLVVAEDVQWIDANSEEFFRALVDGVAAYPILILATHRRGYAPPWQDRSFHHRLAVEPLSRADAARMVEALGGTGAPALDQVVLERAEGNPLFVEELTRYLRERGAADDLPATVQDLLAARIDRLPDPLKHLLQVAAVLGRRFALSLLESVAPVPDVRSGVAELAAHELLQETAVLPEPIYAFTQPLTQQVAYQSLLARSRADLHARAAAALERLFAGRLDDVVEQVAEHYSRSLDRGGAVRYLRRAGDRARRLFAFREAHAYYTRALALLEDGPPGERAELLDAVGDCALAHGGPVEALRAWEEALPLRADDRRHTADLHRKVAAACWAAGRREPALAHLEQGLAALADDRDNLQAGRLYHELARIHVRLGEHEPATRWARQALALGERLGAPDVVAEASNVLGVALARAGDLEGAAGVVGRSLETALAHELGSVACRAYANLAVMYATLDPEESGRLCRQGLALAEKIGDRLQQAWLFCVLAGGYCTVAADYDEGLRAAEAAVELDERLGQHGHLPIPLIILAQIHQCRGEGERSERLYRRALEVAEALGEPQLLVPCYEGLATLAIERDDPEEAERWLERSRRVQDTTGWTSETFLVLPFLC
ncbi:MAG TPA: adenylate/guanylate cyclase domain-containing protein [Candidatus Binatia bacterium]|nr:adenylate/guanylate cyclase domain-containing protein [Candidatus Binatia bacterium]